MICPGEKSKSSDYRYLGTARILEHFGIFFRNGLRSATKQRDQGDNNKERITKKDSEKSSCGAPERYHN